RIAVVKAPVIDAANVVESADELDHVAQRHALPQPLTERLGDVETLHRLEELAAVLPPQLLDGRQIQGVALVQRARRINPARAVADDLQPPRFGSEAGLDQGVA